MKDKSGNTITFEEVQKMVALQQANSKIKRTIRIKQIPHLSAIKYYYVETFLDEVRKRLREQESWLICTYNILTKEYKRTGYFQASMSKINLTRYKIKADV